jgi:hypothetical protein
MTEAAMKILVDHGTKIILAIVAIFATGIVIKFKFKSKDNSNKVTQKENVVLGDNAGRDIRKK